MEQVKVKKEMRSGIMKKSKQKWNVLFTSTMVMLYMFLSSPLVEASQKKATPKLFTNTKTLAKDAGGWIIGIVAVCAGAYMAYLGFRYAMTDDPGSRNEVKKAMKNVVIGIAIALSAGGLITAIASYY